MAWFIGQSAVMILLAFLLGLLVGWIIWARRLRIVLGEVKALRAEVADCKANHGAASAVATSSGDALAGTPSAGAPSTVAPSTVAASGDAASASGETEPATVHIPTPRAEVTDASGLEVPTATATATATAAATNAADAEIDADGAAKPTKRSARKSAKAAKAAAVESAAGTAVESAAEAAAEPAVGSATTAAAPSAAEPALESAAEPGLESASESAASPAGERAAAADGSGDGAGRVVEDRLDDAAELKAADDLIRIEGIGPRIAAALIAAGIDSYQKVAASDVPTLTRAIRSARITFAPSLATWPEQAQLLADGDEAGFVALSDRIIAGRSAADARTTKAAASNGAAVAVQPVDAVPAQITPADTAAAETAAAETAPTETEPNKTEPNRTEPIRTEPIRTEPIGAASTESAPADEPQIARNTEAPPDDLARIEGIGPKIASALVAAGIRTFGRLADADEATLRTATTAAGIRFAPSIVTWSEQARLLADGNEDEFAVLTARLIAGRRANDDLKRIEGIGPQMEAALQAAGIRTYRALADSDDTTLRRAISNNGLKFAPSIVTWARQARLLADGDEEGFADLTRRLVAGRDEGRV